MSVMVLENTRILSATMRDKNLEFQLAVMMECDFRGEVCGWFDLTGDPGRHLMSGRLDGEMRRVTMGFLSVDQEMTSEEFDIGASRIAGFSLRAALCPATKRVTGHRLRFTAFCDDPKAAMRVSRWISIMGLAAADVGIHFPEQAVLPLEPAPEAEEYDAAEWRTEDEIAAGVPR